jgi:hypothetical protein
MSMARRGWTFIVVFVMVVGIVARLAGVRSLELWSDEARWCEHLLTGTGTWFRPVGYMWVTRQILEVFGVSAPALRSLSTLSGILLLPLVYVVLLRIVQHRTVALAATWLLAIHPVAVAMSKEFKPYIVEALMHAILIGLTLLVVEAGVRRRRWLILLCVTSTIAPLFAWTVVFLYPAIYVLVGLAEWRARRFRDVGILAVGCASTLAVLAGIFLARLASKKPATEYWGKKYDVFFVGDEPLGFVSWFVRKTAGLASFPAWLQMPWPAWLEWTIRATAVVLVAVGITSIIRARRHHLTALLMAPWGVMVVFNFIGAWPYGLFRTNTFMLLYTFLLLAIGLDAVVTFATAHARVRPIAVVFAGIFAVLTIPWEATALASKGPGTLTSQSSVRAALAHVYEVEEGRPMTTPVDDERLFERIVRADVARRAERDAISPDELQNNAGVSQPLLVLDGHACTIARYYRDFDDESRSVFEDWLPGHFVTMCVSYKRSAWINTLRTLRGRDFWLISAKTGWQKVTRETLAPLCEIDVDITFPPSTHLLHCRHRPDLEPTLNATGNSSDNDKDDEGQEDEED